MGYWGSSWDFCDGCTGGAETRYRNKITGETITLYLCGAGLCGLVNGPSFPDDMENWEEIND